MLNYNMLDVRGKQNYMQWSRSAKTNYKRFRRKKLKDLADPCRNLLIVGRAKIHLNTTLTGSLLKSYSDRRGCAKGGRGKLSYNKTWTRAMADSWDRIWPVRKFGQSWDF